jgi:AAA domain
MHFPDHFLEQLRAALPVMQVAQRHYKLRKAGGAEWKVVDDPSIGVNTAKNTWADFGKGQTAGDIIELEMFATRCTFQEAVERLAQLAGLPLPGARSKTNGAKPPPEKARQGTPGGRRQFVEITAAYDYADADGLLVYQVCRQEWVEDGKRKKTFLQRRPAGAICEHRDDQHWVWGLGEGVYLQGRDTNFYAATKDRIDRWTGAERIEVAGTPHMLYRLPELREEMAQDRDERRVIFIPEGEKDCDTLAAWACVATTNSGGAQNWKDHHAAEFKDADAVVLLDNDIAGRQRGHAVAASLRGIAERVRVLSWPDHWPECPDGGDVTDWRDKAGGDVSKLFQIVDGLADWSPSPPLTAFSATRYIDIDQPSRLLQWTVKGILQRATISLWYGAPASGKSFLLTDLGMAVARGVAWMGHKTRPGLVIYQTGEGGVGFRQRIKAYRKHHSLPATDNIPFVYLPVRINLFRDDAEIDELIAEIKAWVAFYDHPLELVAIDTFNAASSGANENTNSDVARVLDRCRKIVDATGSHVAVVHHTPKTGSAPRGHSSLVGDVETTIAIEDTGQPDLEADEDGVRAARSARSWVVTKQKDGPDRINRTFTLRSVQVGVDDDGDPITSCIVLPRESAVAAASKGAVPPDWHVLHPANDDIFRSLVRALRRFGTTEPPAGVEAPKGELCVTIKQWQAELLELMVGHEEVTATLSMRIKQRIYRASKAWLPDRVNLIAKQGEWVWRTQRRVYGVDRIPVERPQPEPLLAPGEDIRAFEDLYKTYGKP